MKKNKNIQTGLIGLLALIVGFLIGIFVDIPSTNTDDLAGAIGKVDRYRNVQVTEDDILLRNELVEDTVKLELYQNYLDYYYYQALRTAHDLDKVLQNTKRVAEFSEKYAGSINALASYREYLKTAQSDIFLANIMLSSLDENEEVPVIGYLNQANNAVARIRSNNDILVDYLNSLETFVENNPEKEYPMLADAHDILSVNVISYAFVTKDKPLLKYLDQTKLMNKQEELKDLVKQDQFNDFVAGQIKLDAEKVGSYVSDMESLGLLVLLNDMESMQDVVMNDMDKLNIVFDAENLGAIVFDQENLGVLDAEKLNAINDMDQLGIFMDNPLLDGAFLNTEAVELNLRPM